jgi:large subunit ribosomal protein L31
MKKDIHPEYAEVEVKCTCGATFSVMSTRKELNIEVCSQCHPFFTGAKRFIDSSGRVDKFQKRFADWDAKKALEKDAKK